MVFSQSERAQLPNHIITWNGEALARQRAILGALQGVRGWSK